MHPYYNLLYHLKRIFVARIRFHKTATKVYNYTNFSHSNTVNLIKREPRASPTIIPMYIAHIQS